MEVGMFVEAECVGASSCIGHRELLEAPSTVSQGTGEIRVTCLPCSGLHPCRHLQTIISYDLQVDDQSD